MRMREGVGLKIIVETFKVERFFAPRFLPAMQG
jgi:hypothetical protein